ncbi:MAG: adenylate/guanylate cyclase domain-containing protein [Elusimicrobiota bacterium]|jgi:adenylate cyclase
MRKNSWISLILTLAIAALCAFLEQRRGAYFNNPSIDLDTSASSPLRRLDYFLARRVQRAEWATQDIRFQLRRCRTPHPDVAIIAIDDASLKDLHQWPWPRRIHARLIETLAKAPPKALLFDVFFIEPFTSDKEGDKLLSRATARHPWVVHSLYFDLKNERIVGFTPPFPQLLQAMREAGFVNAVIDDDGVLRNAIPTLRYQDQRFNLLSLIGAGYYLGETPEKLVSELPRDARGHLTVNFAGKEHTFPYYSYAAVLSGKIPAETFAGKAVLVGAEATGTYDHYPTPMSKNMPGVELHANVIDNLLWHNSLRQAGLRWTYAAIGVFALLCGLVLVRFSAGAGALAVVSLGLLYAGVAQWFFASRHLVIDMAGPLAALAFGYVAMVLYRFFTEEKEKRWVKAAFGQYVSPKVLDALMADPSKLKLVGERREMSVFFSDIAGFTSISERMNPDELVVLLNRYLSSMTEVIFEYDGYLNKYMGDGIMAFWNAPVKQPDHAERTCRCALKSIQRLNQLNQELKAEGLNPLSIRIGVNSGVMVVGNMGSQQKSDYTVMGDNVNLGSRLEGANKAFGTCIMISEFTYELVQDKFDVRFLDKIRVPGKAKPVITYELLGEKGSLSSLWQQALPLYHEAIQLFAQREFEPARLKFLEVLKILGHDKACETYIQRVEAFRADPPAENWDGVFEVKTK